VVLSAFCAFLLVSFAEVWVTTDAIPDGEESTRLHRWGCQRYAEIWSEATVRGSLHLADKAAA